METIETSLIDSGQVRRAVRRLADTFGLPLETRARLTLSVAGVARAALRQGSTVRLRAQSRAGDDPEHAGTVSFTLTTCPSPPEPYEESPLPLPLPPRAGRSGEWVWRLPLPPPGPSRESHGDEAAEDEVEAVLASLDSLAASHRQLKDELDETNSGVLALYVQLEERDEQLRHAHGQMLRELEDALRPSP